MKNIIKIIAVGLILVSTSSSVLAGGTGKYNIIEGEYTGSLKDEPVNTKMSVKGYISVESIGYGDSGFGGSNIKFGTSFLKNYGAYGIEPRFSFGLFYPEDDVQIIEGEKYNGEPRYGVNESKLDFNDGLMLFASKDLVESLNYYDPSYFGKEYNNGKGFYKNGLINGKYVQLFRTEVPGDLRGNILTGIRGSYDKKEGNIIIHGEIKDINIDDEFYICDDIWEEKRCLTSINEVKRYFYSGKGNVKQFENDFKNIWDSHRLQDVKIKTKIFVMDKITVDGVTYGKKAPIYKLSNKEKLALDKAIEPVKNYSIEKIIEIVQNIDYNVLDLYRYGRKNYEVIKYVSDSLKKTIEEVRKKEAEEVLERLKDMDYDTDKFIENLKKGIIKAD